MKNILKGTFREMTRHPTLMAPSLAAMALVFLLSVATIGGSPLFGRAGGEVLSDGLAPRFIGFGSGILVLGLLGTILSFLAHGLTIGMAAEVLLSGTTSLRTPLKLMKRRAVDLLLASLLLGVTVSVGFRLLFVPGLFAAFCFLFTYPIIIVDGGGVIGAARRSLGLIRERPGEAGRLFGTLVAVHVLAWVIGALCWGVPIAGKLISLALSGAVGGSVGVAVLLGYNQLISSPVSPDDLSVEGDSEPAAAPPSPGD